MKNKVQISYVVEEHIKGNIQTSKLITTSIWLACADALIKIRSGKRQGMQCKVFPTIKTRDLNPQVVFLNAFLFQDMCAEKEIRILTKPVIESENRFEKVKTNDYYLSDSYIKALRGLVRHIRTMTNNDINGLLTLITFASLDDNHILWSKYTPNSQSDSLKLDEMREVKANF